MHIHMLQKRSARMHPLDIILTDTARVLDEATVPSDMSLDLHFGCRFYPGCGGLPHLHLAGKASAMLRKTHFDLQGDRQVPSAVDTFPSCN